MIHAFLSASGGDRASHCPPAYALDEGPREESDDARNGTDGHAYLERLQSTSRDEALAFCPDSMRDLCASIDLRDVPKGEAEIAYVYDVATDTAVRLGRIEHRAYEKALGRPLAATEIPCTIDLVSPHEHTMLVTDWKFGFEGVPNPRTSMQLALGALCVSRAHGLDEVLVQIGRIDSVGAIHYDGCELDAFALEDAADRWRTIWTKVQAARDAIANGETLVTTPGDHCRYCPAKASCPSFAGIARELLAPGSDWLARARTLIQDDDGAAADLWMKVQRARELLATVQGLLDARATERPFAIPGGMVVRQVETKRDAVKSPRVVRDVLAEFYGEEAANAAVETELHTTKGAIEKVAKAHAPRGKGAEETRRVLTVLRERNAIVTNTGTSVEAVEAKRGAA
jgi:hypothetical protein